MRISTFFYLTILSLFCSSVKGQEGYGGKIGVNIQFGTHIQRVGVMYQLYYYTNHVQFSNGLYAHFNIKNLGPTSPHAEVQMNFGVQGQWLKTEKEKYLVNETSNLSPFLNSMGYCFYWFVAGNQTSQTTGAIYGAFDAYHFAVNNDAFGLNQVDDKFRTGGFFLGYQVDSVILGLQNTLWTGKSADAPRINDDQYPGKHGYRDVRQSKHGKLSHGILAFRIDYKWQYEQVVRGELGIDSERIRHFIQNKFIHDGLSGTLVKSENPHYPMLQQDGSPYLFKENEKVRSTKPFLQIGLNQPMLY